MSLPSSVSASELLQFKQFIKVLPFFPTQSPCDVATAFGQLDASQIVTAYPQFFRKPFARKKLVKVSAQGSARRLKNGGEVYAKYLCVPILDCFARPSDLFSSFLPGKPSRDVLDWCDRAFRVMDESEHFAILHQSHAAGIAYNAHCWAPLSLNIINELATSLGTKYVPEFSNILKKKAGVAFIVGYFVAAEEIDEGFDVAEYDVRYVQSHRYPLHPTIAAACRIAAMDVKAKLIEIYNEYFNTGDAKSENYRLEDEDDEDEAWVYIVRVIPVFYDDITAKTGGRNAESWNTTAVGRWQ